MKKIILPIAVIAVVAVAALGIYAMMTGGFGNMLSVKMYDQYRQPLTDYFAIVNDVEGVYFISFRTTVTNTGELPLTLNIISASPSQLGSAYSGKGTKVIQPGQSASWDSDMIDVMPFEGTTTQFSVDVEGTYDYGGQTFTLDKQAMATVTVVADPVAGFDVSIEGSVGGTGGGTNGTCDSAGTTCEPAASNCCNACMEDSTVSEVLLDTATINVNTVITCPASETIACRLLDVGRGNEYNIQPGSSKTLFSPATYELYGHEVVTIYQCN